MKTKCNRCKKSFFDRLVGDTCPCGGVLEPWIFSYCQGVNLNVTPEQAQKVLETFRSTYSTIDTLRQKVSKDLIDRGL